MKLIWYSVLGLAMTLWFIQTTFNNVLAGENNLQLNGTLVSDPCELDPQTSDLIIDFKSVIEKNLYSDIRTPGQPFTLNLINCDTALGQQVSFTFTGPESPTLPGLLAVTGTAAGIAIGLESGNGSNLAINKPTTSQALADGLNSFTFKAYVTALPEALQNHTLIAGDFSATATVEMAYP